MAFLSITLFNFIKKKTIKFSIMKKKVNGISSYPNIVTVLEFKPGPTVLNSYASILPT